MMLSLKRIVEQYGAEGQYYDLGRDFSNFRRTIDGMDEQVKQKFEQTIGSKLVGKRIRARASRGYKQYIKTYEFDVTRISLDDYYDNYVVVAYDNTTPKPKEYFLKSGFKIQILGPASGQPSPDKKKKPEAPEPVPTPTTVQPKQDPDVAQHQPMALAPPEHIPSEEPVKEAEQAGYYDAYPIDSIAQDIKGWFPSILTKPETAIRDFVKGLGWLKSLGRGVTVAMFDLKVPAEMIKSHITADTIKKLISKAGKSGSVIDTKYDLVKLEPDPAKGDWDIRIKKTTTDKNA